MAKFIISALVATSICLGQGRVGAPVLNEQALMSTVSQSFVEGDQSELGHSSVTSGANIILKLEDCGGKNTIGHILSMRPAYYFTPGRTTSTAIDFKLDRDIEGATASAKAKMRSFPWLTLYSDKNIDICKFWNYTETFHIRGKWVATVVVNGLPCPLKAGKMTHMVEVSLSDSIPKPLTPRVKINVKAKSRSGNELFCLNIKNYRR